MSDLTLTFPAHQWAVNPCLSSPRWPHPVRMWLESEGGLCMASPCCGAQLSVKYATVLTPEYTYCFKCAKKWPRQSCGGSVAVTSPVGLANLLSRWIDYVSPHTANTGVASVAAQALSSTWPRFVRFYDAVPATVAEEEQVWRELKQVADEATVTW